MSPAMTDDALVRELSEQADRTLPAMSLDVDAVLRAGRRRRRRRAALRGAGTLAVAAVVTIGVVTLGTDRTEIPSATPTPAYQDGAVAIRIADEVGEVMSDVGVVVDLGLPAELPSADQAEPSRWVVQSVPSDTTTTFYFRVMAADGTTFARYTWGPTPAEQHTSQDGARCFYWNMQSQVIAGGLAPEGFAGGTVELVIHDAGGAPVRLPAPTFRAPGVAADIIAFTVTDNGGDGSGLLPSELPEASLEFTWPGGAVSECPVLPVGSLDDATAPSYTIEVTGDVTATG